MHDSLPRRANGFTMIEILIVMVIIGILSTLAVTNLMTAQARARDAKRRGDIKTLQTAFEQYYSTNAGYAADCQTMATVEVLPQGVGSDPTLNIPYTDNSFCQAETDSYCVCAQLEMGGGNATAGPLSASCSFISSGDRPFYCLSNVQ